MGPPNEIRQQHPSNPINALNAGCSLVAKKGSGIEGVRVEMTSGEILPLIDIPNLMRSKGQNVPARPGRMLFSLGRPPCVEDVSAILHPLLGLHKVLGPARMGESTHKCFGFFGLCTSRGCYSLKTYSRKEI
jgi:hypothetical protein